jgi:hypothetical protein
VNQESTAAEWRTSTHKQRHRRDEWKILVGVIEAIGRLNERGNKRASVDRRCLVF